MQCDELILFMHGWRVWRHSVWGEIFWCGNDSSWWWHESGMRMKGAVTLIHRMFGAEYYCGALLCPSVLWRCWLDDRKGNRPVKSTSRKNSQMFTCGSWRNLNIDSHWSDVACHTCRLQRTWKTFVCLHSCEFRDSTVTDSAVMSWYLCVTCCVVHECDTLLCVGTWVWHVSVHECDTLLCVGTWVWHVVMCWYMSVTCVGTWVWHVVMCWYMSVTCYVLVHECDTLLCVGTWVWRVCFLAWHLLNTWVWHVMCRCMSVNVMCRYMSVTCCYVLVHECHIFCIGTWVWHVIMCWYGRWFLNHCGQLTLRRTSRQ